MPGEVFHPQYTYNNSGTSTWSVGSYFLRNLAGPSDIYSGSQVGIGNNVSPGNPYTWTLSVQAPNSPGSSTVDSWQPAGPSGLFGDTAVSESLNVSVDGSTFVTESPDQEYVNASPGQLVTLHYTLKNTGGTSWVGMSPNASYGHYQAGSYNFSTLQRYGFTNLSGLADYYSGSSILLPQGDNVTPGGSWNWAITLKAPTTAGQYASKWQMTDSEIGSSSVEHFGAITTTVLVVQGSSNQPPNPTPPGAPGQPTATAGNAEVHLSWSAPSSDGGSAISSYQITPYVNGAKQGVIDTGSSSTSYTVGNLVNKTSYTFEIAATNAVGTGPDSPPSDAVTPEAPASAPAVSSVAPSSGPAAGGTGVTIEGSNFAGATAVSFGSTPAASFSVQSSSEITAQSPAGSPGSVAVSVVTPAGSSSPSSGDLFTYLSPASTGPMSTTGSYEAISPTRICDMRTGNPSGLSGAAAQCAGKTLGAGSVLNVQVAGIGPIPSDATGVVGNLIALGATRPTYLSIYPSGETPPVAANLDPSTPAPVSVAFSAPLGHSGALSIYNFAGQVDIVVDIEGYLASGSSGNLYQPVSPTRILDTRCGASAPPAYCSSESLPANNADLGTLGAGSVVDVQAAGVGPVPSDATGIVANLTVTDTTSGGYLSAWPTGNSMPVSSVLDWQPGATRANRVFLPLGQGGQVSLFNSAGSTDVVMDVVGFFSASQAGSGSAGTAAGELTFVAPDRICDTRAGNPSGLSGAAAQCAGKTLGAGSVLNVQVTGIGTVPSGAKAVILDVTTTDTTASSYLTAWATGSGRPVSSAMNWAPGGSASNLLVVPVGSSGEVSFYNAAGQVDLVVDAVGWVQ